MSLALVLGGTRSGKSGYAEALITQHHASGDPPGADGRDRWVYLATAEALDDEMVERVARHQASRGGGWTTRECPHALTEAIAALAPGTPVLVDSLGMWVSNRLLAGADLATERAALVGALRASRAHLVLVSDEVGFGIVPDNALARRFRDTLGELNQAVAAIADEVVLMVAGLPLKVKG